ncbi:MAG TPA: paraquat-inducible protein A [Leucothrix mucor]|nr:paraquat-inducible protein A [Leucothrix mucor]
MEFDSLNHSEIRSQISHIACPDCDLLQTIPALANKQVAHCLRCHSTLFKNQKNSIDRSLAFAITGLILFIISNLFPLLSLKALGLTQDGTLLTTALSLFKANQPLLSILMLFTTIIFPATTLIGTIYILIQIKTDKINHYTAPIFRFLRSTEAWGMLEILMLAILVTLVKLGDIADVIIGTSLYAFCLLILALSLLSYSLNPHDVWNKLRIKNGCAL